MFKDNLNTITLIEWPQIIKVKPKYLIELEFEYGKDHQTRSVQIKGISLSYIKNDDERRIRRINEIYTKYFAGSKTVS